MPTRNIRTVAVDTEKAARQEYPRLRAAVANLTRYEQDEKEILEFVKTTIKETQAKIDHENEAKEKANENLRKATKPSRRS
jgi:hypothetical protein